MRISVATEQPWDIRADVPFVPACAGVTVRFRARPGVPLDLSRLVWQRVATRGR